MIGKAVDENLIYNVHDPIINYLPELLTNDSAYQKLLLSDVLDMRSGIRFKDHDLPWGDKSKAYYDPNLKERIMQLPMEEERGRSFDYNYYNPILAGMILEKVAGISPAEYLKKRFGVN